VDSFRRKKVLQQALAADQAERHSKTKQLHLDEIREILSRARDTSLTEMAPPEGTPHRQTGAEVSPDSAKSWKAEGDNVSIDSLGDFPCVVIPFTCNQAEDVMTAWSLSPEDKAKVVVQFVLESDINLEGQDVLGDFCVRFRQREQLLDQQEKLWARAASGTLSGKEVQTNSAKLRELNRVLTFWSCKTYAQSDKLASSAAQRDRDYAFFQGSVGRIAPVQEVPARLLKFAAGYCKNNLHQIGLAWHSFHDVTGQATKEVEADWFAVLAPYLEISAASELNAKQFQCPLDPAALTKSHTSFVIVNGPGTAWDKLMKKQPTGPDGILFIDAHGLRDNQKCITAEEAIDIIISGSNGHRGKTYAVRADASVTIIDASWGAERVRKLFTVGQQ
jgi:hypothetical protein